MIRLLAALLVIAPSLAMAESNVAVGAERLQASARVQIVITIPQTLAVAQPAYSPLPLASTNDRRIVVSNTVAYRIARPLVYADASNDQIRLPVSYFSLVFTAATP